MTKVRRYYCRKHHTVDEEPMTEEEMIEHLIEFHLDELWKKYVKGIVVKTDEIFDGDEIIYN